MTYVDPFIALPVEPVEQVSSFLSLSDINRVTNSHDGDIYSDLYKDVYGSRPRYAQFESIEEFDKDFEYLAEKLNVQIEEEKIRNEKNFQAFVGQVEKIQELIPGTDLVRAIEILAESEDELEAFQFYGYERLEYHFGLKFGSIKQWLETL